MMNKNILDKNSIKNVIEEYPFINNFLEQNNLKVEDNKMNLREFFQKLNYEEVGTTGKELEVAFLEYFTQMIEFLGIEENENQIKSLTILPGAHKDGKLEKFGKLTINKGEIICIVGPTGSGKSRLLADIEWTAQKDTPTKRSVLIDDKKPDNKWRYSSSNRLVAQLSQNMNFVMDLSVYEFLELHAKSRMLENAEEIIEKIINKANELAGEKFNLDTPITSLSGGQSRSLMIADTAILSKSPIVLIDEIENAGIDRKKALELLVGEEKIVLMATHDPILALMGDKRIVINNGGITKVINTSETEKKFLGELEKMDSVIQNMRHKLRYGEIIDSLN